MQDKLIRHLESTLASKGCYQNSFKAFIVLISVVLLAMSESMSIIIPMEIKAMEHKIQWQKQQNNQKLDLSRQKCFVKNDSYENCAKAKAYADMANKGVDTLDTFFSLIGKLAIFLLILSIISFIYHPIYQQRDET